MSTLASGSRLQDRFTLIELIGAGGMSEVWRAGDAVLGREVAVKVLRGPLAGDRLLGSATWAEARTAARLAHPHVAQVYDFGQQRSPDGRLLPYLVMELVRGENLADRLRAGPLPWRQAARSGADIASALAAAHRAGVVHRDIKPANVMLTVSGAKVLDFGIAALAGGAADPDGGRLVGTPGYAAPERLRPGAAEPASDVYALGVLLYESVTGRLPVPVATWRDAAAAHRAAVAVAPPPVPGLPREVAATILACLSPDPAARPAADQVMRVLAAAADAPAAGAASTRPAGPPTLVGDPLAAVDGGGRRPAGAPRPGYAVGSAPLPHPPTMIDDRAAMPAVDLPASGQHHLPRPLLFGLISAVVVLGLALVVVTSVLLSASRGPSAQPPAAAAGSAATASPSPTAAPAPSTARQLADQLDAAVQAALAAGSIDADTAHELDSRISDIRQAAGDGAGHSRKVRGKIQDLTKTITQFTDDGRLDPQTAGQLNTLLEQFVASGTPGTSG